MHIYTVFLTNFSRIWQTLPELTKSCHNLPEYAIALPQFALVCHRLPQANQTGRIRQNSAELICRVFHRDILTVTGPVPLQYLTLNFLKAGLKLLYLILAYSLYKKLSLIT
jgi:hypothetical protein